jgi:1-acyl-sn-glycerol-3-phosphate acyltransferase
MPLLARSEATNPPQHVTRWGHALRLYAGLAVLAAMCLLISPLMLAMGLFRSAQGRRRVARSTITWVFSRHFALMQRLGVMRLELDALDALQDAPAMLIAPNHPSLIDAALLLSRLPDLTCIMKAQVLQNLLFGSGARMAGYITSDPLRDMLRAACDGLHEGRHMLLFPEGTRTRQLPVNPMQRTVGVIARRAGVPVQTVIIETNTAFLGKGWPLLRVPVLPMTYRVRLGRRFAPPLDVDAFTDELQAYFHHELASARLPVLPVADDSR